MLGVDEVVGDRLVDGHGHRPGAVGVVATVDGDGLVVHALQPLLFGRLRPTSWRTARWPRPATARSARAPTSSKGNDSTSAGSRSPPTIRSCRCCELLPVVGGHAVEGQAGQRRRARGARSAGRRGGTRGAGWTGRTRGGPGPGRPRSRPHGLGDHAPADGVRLAGPPRSRRPAPSSTATVLSREWGRTIGGAEAGGQRDGRGRPAGGRRRCTWPAASVRSMPSKTARAAWADRQDSSMEGTCSRPHDSRPARSAQ